MNILGINAYHGNASAAIVCDGSLIAAVEEERFNRVKYAAGFPAQAIRYCLKEAGLTLADVDHVAVPRNPYARLGTKLFYALRMPSFARERVKVLAKFTGIPEALAAAFEVDPRKLGAKFHRIEHHQAHLASSFFVSPKKLLARCAWWCSIRWNTTRHILRAVFSFRRSNAPRCFPPTVSAISRARCG